MSGEQPSHNAFTPASIISKSKSKIVCITAWHDRFIVVSQTRQIRIYKRAPLREITSSSRNGINGSEQKRQYYPPTYTNTQVIDTKREISQMVAVDNRNILVFIADTFVRVNSLPDFRHICLLSKTKGCYLFALNRTSIVGNKPLYLCVAVKKRLILYQWKDREPWFAEQREFATPEKVRTLVFAGRSLCVGYKNEYSLIRVGTGEPSTVFPCGKNKKPVATVLPDRELLLQQDNVGICVGFDGKPTREAGIEWSEPPTEVGYRAPFAIGVLSNTVEIRNMHTRTLTQRIQLKGGRMLSCNGGIMVASPDTVLELANVRIMSQIDDLVDRNNFEEGLTLCDLVSDSEFEAEEVTREEKLSFIHTRYGYFLFNQCDYSGAMFQFQQSLVDPRQVLALIPDVVPEGQCVEARKKHPVKINHIPNSKALNEALAAVIPYLLHLRSQLQFKEASSNSHQHSGLEDDDWKHGPPVEAGEMPLKSLVDTVLLKAYLIFDEKSVMSFLQNDNDCDIVTCEDILKDYEKDLERVFLYRSHGYHRKALKLLHQLGDSAESHLRGTEETVRYLQHLAQDDQYANLVLEYSSWVFLKTPDDICEDGLSIFIDVQPVRSEATGHMEPKRREANIPFATVLNHLKKVSNNLTCIAYLETLIHKCGETGSQFHNDLIEFYLTELIKILPPSASSEGKDGEDSDSDGEEKVYTKAGTEPGRLGKLRGKLLEFLEMSVTYKATKMLPKFPRGQLLEEKAILLRKINRHEKALAIYAYKLRDTEMAERYCDLYYNEHAPHENDIDPESIDRLNSNKRAAQEVYLHLLRVYLKKDGQKPMIQPALNLLRKRFDRIDGPKALDLLPVGTPIKDVCGYLQAVLSHNSQKLRGNQIVKNLLRADNLHVQEGYRETRSSRVVVEDDTQCPRCLKRIGNSAFARYPNGIVVHYICSDDKYTCPVTNMRFGSAV